MQTPDKLTRPFLFKLLVLFALLLSGAMLKVQDKNEAAIQNPAKNISEAAPAHSDNSSIDHLSFKLAR